MRVSQVSVYRQNYYLSTPNRVRSQQTNTSMQSTDNVNFKGKFGAWLGAAIGGVAVVATACVAAVPAIACLAGGGAFLGAVGLDTAEDAINGKKDND